MLLLSHHPQPPALVVERTYLGTVGQWRRISFHNLLRLKALQRLNDDVGAKNIKCAGLKESHVVATVAGPTPKQSHRR
jgi:hypothetical protein